MLSNFTGVVVAKPVVNHKPVRQISLFEQQMIQQQRDQAEIAIAQRKLAIEAIRRRREAQDRKPIFDRSKMPKTLGYMYAAMVMAESTKHNHLWSQLFQGVK
jgi:hypothetical protein